MKPRFRNFNEFLAVTKWRTARNFVHSRRTRDLIQNSGREDFCLVTHTIGVFLCSLTKVPTFFTMGAFLYPLKKAVMQPKQPVKLEAKVGIQYNQ